MSGLEDKTEGKENESKEQKIKKFLGDNVVSFVAGFLAGYVTGKGYHYFNNEVEPMNPMVLGAGVTLIGDFLNYNGISFSQKRRAQKGDIKKVARDSLGSFAGISLGYYVGAF